MNDFRHGGIVKPSETAQPEPPSHIPAGGTCWRAPDGSHEWLIPNPQCGNKSPGEDDEMGVEYGPDDVADGRPF